MKLLAVSDIFSDLFRASPDLDEALALEPVQAGYLLARPWIADMPVMHNLAVCYRLWWASPSRTVWRVRPATAAKLREVNLNFLPDKPPATWSGGALVLESEDKATPMVARAFAVAAYYLADTAGAMRYYIVALEAPDGVWCFSVRADVGALNARLAASGSLLDLPELRRDGLLDVSPQRQADALDILRFVLAASYYAERPDLEHVAVRTTAGPLERDARGRVVKGSGRTRPLWTYSDLAVSAPSGVHESRGPLDKTSLALSPTVVRPYIRRHADGTVVIVDAHASHRWRRMEQMRKTRI